MDFNEIMRAAQEKSRLLDKAKVDKQVQRDKVLKNVQRDELLRKKKDLTPEEKAERKRKLMEKVSKDLSSQQDHDRSNEGKGKRCFERTAHNPNKSKPLSAAQIREQRLALQEKARKLLYEPLKKLSATEPRQTTSLKDSPRPARSNLVPASQLGLVPLSQKMEEVLAAKNNINYTKRVISSDHKTEKKKHKKKKKERDERHSKRKDVRVAEPEPKKPKLVKHSIRQANMKPLSFDELLKQANNNKDKAVDWKQLESEQKERKQAMEKQKDIDRREKLRILVPEKSPRKNNRAMPPQPPSRSAVKPALPHQSRVSTVQTQPVPRPSINQKVVKKKERKPSPVPVPKIPKELYNSDYGYDEEYDDEMNDFIDDDGYGGGVNSNEIWKIMGYDKRKYERNNDFDDIDNMESNFGEIDAEERRSAKIGKREDLEDIRREEEEKKRKRERLKKKKF